MLIRLEYNDRVIHQINAKDISNEIIIGRSSACTWGMPKDDKLASSRHVSLTKRGGTILLKDLDSTNGTFFNGKRITSRKLREGDKIGVGNCILYAMPDVGSAKNRYSELLVLSGKERNKKKSLVPPKFTIGSDPGSSLVFLDMLVSRHHAEITINEDGSCWLKDLNSKNGTFVNGVPLRADKERLLKDGDKISFSQMEVEFHDGAVIRATSHVWLKLAIIVLTCVVAVGAYNLYKRLQPSAGSYIEASRKLAAKEQFVDARELLLKAENAHHAEAQQVEILQLRRLLGIWERTSAMWRDTQGMLQEQKWTNVSRNLGQLHGEKSEAWEWNKKAVEQREQALYAKSMLDARSRFMAMLARETVEVEQLRSLTADAGTLVAQFKADALPDYLRPLHQELVNSCAQLRDLLKEALAIEMAMDKLRHDNPPYQEIASAITQAAQSEKRVIQYRAAKLEPVVQGLAESARILNAVIGYVRALEAKKITESDLNLPSSDACTLDPRASAARLTLEKRYNDVRLLGSQAVLFYEEIESIIGSTDRDIPHLTEFKSAAVMQRVFACDALEQNLPRRSRNQAVGDYDRILGVEEFYAYLDALPEPMNPAMVADINFKPLATQAHELWKKIDMFVAFVKKPEHSWMLDNKLKLQLERCEMLLSLRDELINELLTKASGSAGRESLIAAGIASRIASSGTALAIADKPAVEWIDATFKEYRRAIIKLNDEFSLASLEDKTALRDKVLSMGLPGDPVVRRMWAMRDAARGK